MKNNSVLRNILYFILTALVLCIPALYNRYALYYTDSALYLESAITLMPKVDRPIGYGFFIRATTWQYSMWLVVFAQGLIASLLIYHTMKTVLVNLVFKRVYHFLTVFGLSIFSTLGWYVSLLMPDVFASFLILVIFNMIFARNNLFTYILYSALLFFIIFSHLSNIPIFLLTLLTVWVFVILKKNFRTHWRLALPGTIVAVLIFLGTVTYLVKYNYDHFHKAKISTTSGIFFFARLIDAGVVDVYLKDQCGKKDYRICKYKDEMPDYSQTFIWDFNSPFYKLGAWTYYQEEPSIIVSDILKSPKYYGMIAKDFSLSTLKQLLQFRVGGDLLNFRKEFVDVYENTYRVYHKDEIKHEFFRAKQQQDELDFDLLNQVMLVIIILSVMLIAVVISRYTLDYKMYMLLVTGFAGVFFNAAVCANLSNVLNRYQARVVWIIPLLAILLFLELILPRFIKILRKRTL